jgi:WD40 repeat protein
MEVWNLSALRDLRRVYLRERTIRWQVARGLRGNIYALAAAPNDALLAIGGYGAMGSLGEILVVNPVDGKLVKVLEGHRQTVCSLAFSHDGDWLASMDTAGETRLWKRGSWTSTVLYAQDAKTYGPEQAAMIQKQPKFRPVAFAAGHEVVVPGFVGRSGEGLLQWQLIRIHAENTTDYRALKTVHRGMVTAMASSADGSRLASADSTGRLYVWDLARAGEPGILQSGGGVLSLALSPDGRTLVAGMLASGPERKGQLQVWDLATRTLTRKVLVADHVYACAISPDGKRLAYSGGDQGEVFVASLAEGGEPAVLRGIGRRIGRVAFAKEEPGYRVAFGVASAGQAMNESGDFHESFDPVRLSLGEKRPSPVDWIPASHASGGWTVRPQNDRTLRLLRDAVPQGTVAIRAQVPGLEEGRPRCYCWLPGPDGNPMAIVMGTDLQHSIYVQTS